MPRGDGVKNTAAYGDYAKNGQEKAFHEVFDIFGIIIDLLYKRKFTHQAYCDIRPLFLETHQAAYLCLNSAAIPYNQTVPGAKAQ